MQSTDTPDFFPEDYDADAVGFTDGMMGSQAKMSGGGTNTATPGMEDFGKGGMVIGGVEENSEIPEGMEFVPGSVPDGNFEFSVASGAKSTEYTISVAPFCMAYEDFYAKFADGSHPSLKVTPAAGRMDRRGGEATDFTVVCEPNGQAGEFEGKLVIVLPEENEKLTYVVTAKAF